MKKVLFLALCCAGLAMSSCGKKTLAEEAADKVCGCPATQEMVKLTKEMDGKSDADKSAIAPKFMELQKQLETCMGDVLTKIKALPMNELTAFDKDSKAAIRKKCPDIAEAMEKK